MTTQLLATELANLVQESKRRNNDLRQAAEKSLEELKSLSDVSEQTVGNVLAAKINFANPFIIACGTKNAKFTAIAIVCLQRLIVAGALPRSKLDQALDALMQASSGGLDVQLKILQALPFLLQNYAGDLKGNLLVTALNICFTLQSSKNAIVNNTSAATLQQLIVSVFDKVVNEDKAEAQDPNGSGASQEIDMATRPAALDAYRIFNDVCLLTENQRPEFLRYSGLAQTFGLELIESVITNHAGVFATHPEQVQILKVRVMPFINSALKGRPAFAASVRLVRLLYTLLRRHMNILPSECASALEILIQLLDQDGTLWRRALCMEVFRGILAEPSLVRRIYALYDAQSSSRDILKPLTATFVRLSTEKPAVIGLGHQSSMPISTPKNPMNASTDQAMLDASGVPGVITSPNTSENDHTGVSVQWSTVRVPCIDQLDKTDPPVIPESYTYSLVLNCLSSLSDGLAKFILPLTVPNEGRSRKKSSKQSDRDSSMPLQESEDQVTRGMEKMVSFKKNPISVNPLDLQDHPLYADVKICSAIVEECWPAILATCSTFLYAALDTDYYHGLVRAFQRFAHVAGLLQLSTPRDAFLTTLGKAAVPPNVLTACLNAGGSRSASVTTPNEASGILGNARGLLSTESLVPPSPVLERQRQSSLDASGPVLNTRNLLCLRALLNLGIALGPTLGSAWVIIFETLQQADFVLFTLGSGPARLQSLSKTQESEGDNSTLMTNFGSEVSSVETAASRLIESTVDFPNEAFLEVVGAVIGLLQLPVDHDSPEADHSSNASLPPPSPHRRKGSFSLQPSSARSVQEDQFALAKLGDLANVNIDRLLTHSPEESGWFLLVHKLIEMLDAAAVKPPVRTRAVEILASLIQECASSSTSIPEDVRGEIQVRLLTALNDARKGLYAPGKQLSVASSATVTDVHRTILDSLKMVIESCGEALVSGWEVAFEIMGSVFVSDDSSLEERRASTTATVTIATRSPKLMRSAFASLQLVSSDFLSSLPKSCFLILVESLYKFSSQNNDLNIALTTVTFFWALSDFLSGKNESINITPAFAGKLDPADLEKLAANREREGSDAALWMLLLLRLTTVASDDRSELRNSAIQTLLRIFDAYGDRLSAEAWAVCIRAVVFKLLDSLTTELEAMQEEDASVSDQAEWHGTAVVVLGGVSSLFANYIDTLVQNSAFSQLWTDLLEHFSNLLEFKIAEVSTATYKALTHIMGQNNAESKVFKKQQLDAAWKLWADKIPPVAPVASPRGGGGGGNQQCLTAYVAALGQLYSLIEAQLDVGQLELILGRLNETVQAESTDAYNSDVENKTQLQSQVLQSISMIRTDIKGAPAAVTRQLSQMVTRAFDQKQTTAASKRTYVAFSKASIVLLEGVLLEHKTERDLYESGAYTMALEALTRPVSLRYQFPIVTKSTQPWRLATTSVLAILSSTLPLLDGFGLSQPRVTEIGSTLVAVADSVTNTDCSNVAVGQDISDDEEFDVRAFQSLQQLIIPALGAEVLAQETRRSYVQSLFHSSLIHRTSLEDETMAEAADIPASIWRPRSGKTMAAAQSRRTRMAYVALEHLFSLVAEKQPSGPVLFGKQEARVMCKTLARTALPVLVLRCALSLRAYASDQPLRGMMPQPLSQRKELIWILQNMVKMGGTTSEEYSGELVRLYPLLVKSLVAGTDEKIQRLVREALEMLGKDVVI